MPYLHERPGWYRDPDDPRRLRYWDGAAWTGRSRKKPPWAARSEAFELHPDSLDRSLEGPVHPRELRQPVASGAWSREWFSWRGRPALQGWHRKVGPGGPSLSWVPHQQPSPKLGPARRSLLAVVCLLVVAAAVVVSGVAVISPYPGSQPAPLRADSRFAVLASQDCRATLPKYRAVLASGTDGQSVYAAAHQVDLLRQRLARVPAGELISATVVEWLDIWARFTAAERKYAALVRAGRRQSAQASLAAEQARQDGRNWAALADQLSANLEVPACRLEPARS